MLLLITERPLIAQTLTHHLLDNGIFFYRAPMETALFHYEKHDVGGVFLDCTSDLTKASALCHRLRALAPEMPIGALVSKADVPDLPAELILRDGNLDIIKNGVLEFCRTHGWEAQPLRSFSLAVEPSNKIYYMGYPLPLSPRERTILRCLFYRYPRLTPTDELMSLCFPDELINIDNLFLHIGVINQHALKIDPRPLIVNVYDKGYRLREGL